MVIPESDIRNVLKIAGYGGKPKLYYQTYAQGSSHSLMPRSQIEAEDLLKLENEVINPAQIANPEVADAMRRRNFGEAARLILKDEYASRIIRRIYPQICVSNGSGGYYPIGTNFLVPKLESLFGADAMLARELKTRFNVRAEHLYNLS